MHSLVAVNGVGDTACQATPRCQALDEMIDIGPRAGEDLLRERARKALVRRAPSFRSSQRAWSVVLAFSKKSPSTPEAAGCSAPRRTASNLALTQRLEAVTVRFISPLFRTTRRLEGDICPTTPRLRPWWGSQEERIGGTAGAPRMTLRRGSGCQPMVACICC